LTLTMPNLTIMISSHSKVVMSHYTFLTKPNAKSWWIAKRLARLPALQVAGG
jgi:hypothetical protein